MCASDDNASCPRWFEEMPIGERGRGEADWSDRSDQG